jgi:hypothetical protein
MDILRVTKGKLDDLAKKGIPKVLVDVSLLQLILDDHIYFDNDFVLYSMTPIEGYRKWSDLFLT